ncbi:PTS sugar transporter subunit IIA [Agathobaculum sp. NTUH-O15-33]|uniref:PTS sugar transporter subunit IIA n=1 Tax=Agathobaculum sp. NTUH-O15-33 TaxID=3079302 RepID=UPI0029587BCF|nr:PTS sugar transporter subunit IIA [Agathobaculum sp. NTUH-O15-33]WNX83898.1 PTS sugar transporter subunit IIA [Agathobaculum sp. NTUH-O15-33]
MGTEAKLLMNQIIFEPGLVTVGIDAADRRQAILATAKPLLDAGYVHPSYPNAVCQREQVFSTGLELYDCFVAIPHTDAVHVKQSAIAIGRLREPVPFCLMGEPDRQGAVRLLVMLAISDPSMQIDVLGRLMDLFQTEGAVNSLLGAASAAALAARFTALMEA